MKKIVCLFFGLLPVLFIISQDLKKLEVVSKKTISNKLNPSSYITTLRLRDSGYVIYYEKKGEYVGGGVIRLDEIGSVNWEKIFDSASINNIQQTSDNGFILCGTTINQKRKLVWFQLNGIAHGSPANYDYWVAKLDSLGNLQWQKSYGGDQADQATFIGQTTDGGYIVCGASESNNKDVRGNHGGGDYWILKLTSTGEIEWKKTYGGPNITGPGYDNPPGQDIPKYIRQTKDGGYFVAGNTTTGIFSNNPRYPSDVKDNHGGTDIWILKLNNQGKIEWQQSLGKEGSDDLSAIINTEDEGFVIVNKTNPSQPGACYVTKINKMGSIEWNTQVKGENTYFGSWSILNLKDNNYLVKSNSYHRNDSSVLMKIEATGKVLWEQEFKNEFSLFEIPFENNDSSYSVIYLSADTLPPPRLVLFAQLKTKKPENAEQKTKSIDKKNSKQAIKKPTSSTKKPKN